MKVIRFFIIALVLIFALIGLLFTGVFVAMEFGWLNVRGSIDERNKSILLPPAVVNTANSIEATFPTSITAPEQPVVPDYSCSDQAVTCFWTSTREWSVVAGGLSKDLTAINQVSAETGVPARLIAAVIVPEQLRFFTSNRDVFKRYFEPLKILGSLSQFSLGVSGIKQDTAELIEQYAADPTSPFYPGADIAPLLQYTQTEDVDTELFNRLTNEKDHYYSYLYTAIYIKEITSQWERAGFDISNQPAIVATLFNLGFTKSSPKANPQIGGAVITVGGIEYTFGELSELFYLSQQLPAFK